MEMGLAYKNTLTLQEKIVFATQVYNYASFYLERQINNLFTLLIVEYYK